MKLREFLLHHTKVWELCIITEQGWNAGSAYIDHEDLFMYGINNNLLNKEVVSEKWEDYEFINKKGTRQVIEVHAIDVK